MATIIPFAKTDSFDKRQTKKQGNKSSQSQLLRDKSSSKQTSFPILNLSSTDLDLPRITTDPTSTSKDFKSFQESISHPVFRLGIAESVNASTLLAHQDTPFSNLTHLTLESLSDLEVAVEDLVRWNHTDLSKSTLPSSLKLEITLLLSKLYRCKSSIHAPLIDLLAQVKLYAKTWNVNRLAMLELERDYQRHYYVLDVAIRKLEGVESRIMKMKAQHNLGLWEKLALRVLSGENGGEGKNGGQSVDSVQSKPVVAQRQYRPPLDMGGNGGPQLEWILTKQAIIDGIIDEPPWRTQLRQVIQSFKTLLTDLHPGWHQIMKSPWIKRGINYLSSRTGTCRLKKQTHIPRSTSLPNLRAYYAHEKQVRHYLAWTLDKENQRVDERGMKIGSLAPNPLRNLSPRVRVNSTNARHDLLELASDIAGGDATDIDQMHIQEEIVDIDAPVEIELVEDMQPEHHYFKDIMTPESHEALMKLVKAQSTMESRVKARDTEVEVEDKDTFDLAEVMELTLLHAQQLHVLKDEYEGREMIMQEELDQLKKEKDEELALWRKKVEVLEAQANEGIRIEYKDGTQPRAPSSDNSRSSAPATNESKLGAVRRKSTIAARSSNSLKSNLSVPAKPPPRKLSIKPDIPKAAEKPREETLISFKNRNQHSAQQGPRFTSAPFTLTFFERLEWFSKASVKLHEKLRLEAQSLERKENERKLAYLNLIADSESDRIKEEIPAEFMPMPGNIPSSFKAARDSFIFSDQVGANGPWGGRFKIAEKANRLNILNLFDMALTLPKEEPQQNEDDSDYSDNE